jgi:hypothetical protein
MESKELKTKQVLFKVSVEEYNFYKDESKKRFMTMSEFIRHALNIFLKKA